jgi:hypothetical protein
LKDGSEPAHSHDGYEETIYGLEGVLTWTIEGVPVDVGPGEALCIPGAPSTSSTTPATSTRRRSRSAPGHPRPDYFREMAAILDAAADGPPDFTALGEVMRRHGLTPAP